MQRLARNFLLVAAASLAVSACTTQPPAETTSRFACPDISIIAEASRTTQWRPGAGRDLTDVISDIRLDGASGECTVQEKGDRVSVVFSVRIAAESGPANTSRSIAVPYFIALVDKDRKVVVRERFNSSFNFPPNLNRMGFFDEFEHEFRLTGGALARDYAYFIGFELSPEELERNRSRMNIR